MDPAFFERPILNSPYAYPGRHWELDPDGLPTGQIVQRRRDARFITPIPRRSSTSYVATWTDGASSETPATGA
jgi:hypothetical protein